VNALVPRAIIAVVAVLLVAWFAVLARDQLIGTRALDRVEANPAMSRADWERTVDDLRRAELLNPGSEFRLARAAALILHDRPAAQRLVDSILRREPYNVEAWSILLAATRGRDEARFQEALEQVRRLTGIRAVHD
jgi:hypothetical protein